MLPVLCLMQTRRLCLPSLLWGCVSDSQSILCPPGFLGPFLQSCFPTGCSRWSFLGLFPSWKENFALPFAGLSEIPFCSLLHPIKVSQNGSRSLWWHQPLPPGLYNLWSCAWSTLSCHLGINEDIWLLHHRQRMESKEKTCVYPFFTRWSFLWYMPIFLLDY